MTFSFNLVDRPWIPCVLLPDGRPEVLALGEIFGRAAEVRDVSDASPLVTISIHRLLLAILHRAYQGPAGADEWERIWSAGAFDDQRIDRYLAEWHGRFDLFDPDRPLYQTVEIRLDYARSIAQMVYGLTLGNYVTLFDHSRQDRPPELTPAEAARQVLAIQNFAVGGLVPYQSRHGEPASPYKYAQNSLLTKGAVALVRGRSLFETLMLNLHRYDGSAPFTFVMERDCPAWERDAPARAEERLPDGYVDLLTWQSRRVRLQPEETVDGRIVVRAAVVMKGNQFPSGDVHPKDYETMLTYTRNPRASASQDPWPVLALKPDRAVWRDSAALFQTTGVDATTGAEHQRPRVLDWIAQLTSDGTLPSETQYLVDIYGIATDRASVDLWRHEQLPLPLDLLSDKERLGELRRALEIADAVSGLFSGRILEIPGRGGAKLRKRPSALFTFAEHLLTMSDERQPDREAVRQLAASLAPGDVYWSKLETPYKRLMLTVTSMDQVSARQQWASAVREAAREAWEPLLRSFDTSARALKAMVLADKEFASQLQALLNQYAPYAKEVPDDETQAASAAVR